MKRLTALFLCMLLLTGCATPQMQSPGTFYYPRLDTAYEGSSGVIASEKRELAGLRSDLGAMLQLYLAGPQDAALTHPLPPGTTLLEHTLFEEVLTLRFSRELAQLSGIELTVAAGSLARTFLPLSGASMLILTADGALLNGNTSLRLTTEQLQLHDDSLERLHANFTVYYASEDRRYLIGHEVSVLVSSPEELPLYLLEQLLTPPRDSGLLSALPAGTRFQSVTISDGLCTVDVSSQFDDRRFFNLPAQCLSLMSVVNTLTALDQIDQVEFTVDGKLLIRYGTMSISEPLHRDERCIGPVRTALGEWSADLYLSFGEGGLLVPIPAKLLHNTSMTTEEQVLRALLADTGANGIQSCIPPGTAINSVTIDNGTCYLDLTSGYLSTPELLPISNRVIAATMCALDTVERVQILVNGGIPDGFEEDLFGILIPEDDWFL